MFLEQSVVRVYWWRMNRDVFHTDGSSNIPLDIQQKHKLQSQNPGDCFKFICAVSEVYLSLKT
jgi:hypothetical protein